ncbi:hypothetical protein BA950_14825 [Erythrobacter sp. SAORIC-644]|uniref:hypothetical protein n=1 Tax=Erythrobacter sp. SAORIC-644 TaxID=1869314 RepID=UPI000C9F7A7F|nr:hypothetical protein [Erythrobacter sp. SAORIC-644]PNQ74337.1 hypothetical protein BA950_14825 [Erythrobacter sp. SAORIC-644]
MAKKKTKVATITVLQIQHKRTNFSTYIPKEDFEAHGEEFRANWHVVNEKKVIDPALDAVEETPAQEEAPAEAEADATEAKD